MLPRLLLQSSLWLFFTLGLWADAHIFVYHRFGDERYPSTNTSLKELNEEFQYLKTHHYKVVSLQRVQKALRNHEPIHDNWVVLTVDDGFKSFLKAFPVFQRYHYPFTLFIATKPIEYKYPDFLSWKDLAKISSFGQIALHSHAHPHLVDLSNEEIANDTKKAIELFQKHLVFFPTAYAYPYGEYDDRVKGVVASFGFQSICNQNIGAVGANSDPLDLDRIAMVGKVDIKRALSYKHLDATWIEPKEYPKDSILKKIIVKIPRRYRYAWLYVTGHGWKKVEVENGLVSKKVHYLLSNRRVRVIIKVKDSKINTKILVRSRYGTQ